MVTSKKEKSINDDIPSVIKRGNLLRDPGLRNEIKKIFNFNGIFYYDETNNFRKLSLRQEGFNNAIDGDFILGGIFVPRTSLTNPDFLRTIACVNESVKEVKCRTLCANADFWECIKTKKIGLFS